jgi:hypothetical protein
MENIAAGRSSARRRTLGASKLQLHVGAVDADQLTHRAHRLSLELGILQVLRSDPRRRCHIFSESEVERREGIREEGSRGSLRHCAWHERANEAAPVRVPGARDHGEGKKQRAFRGAIICSGRKWTKGGGRLTAAGHPTPAPPEQLIFWSHKALPLPSGQGAARHPPPLLRGREDVFETPAPDA